MKYYIKKCKGCGKQFETAWTKKGYCSEKCKSIPQIDFTQIEQQVTQKMQEGLLKPLKVR